MSMQCLLFFKSNVDRQNKDTFKTTIKSSKGLAWRSGAIQWPCNGLYSGQKMRVIIK